MIKYFRNIKASILANKAEINELKTTIDELNTSLKELESTLNSIKGTQSDVCTENAIYSTDSAIFYLISEFRQRMLKAYIYSRHTRDDPSSDEMDSYLNSISATHHEVSSLEQAITFLFTSIYGRSPRSDEFSGLKPDSDTNELSLSTGYLYFLQKAQQAEVLVACMVDFSKLKNKK